MKISNAWIGGVNSGKETMVNRLKLFYLRKDQERGDFQNELHDSLATEVWA